LLSLFLRALSYLRKLNQSGRVLKTHREELHIPPLRASRRMPAAWAHALQDGHLVCRTILRSEYMRCQSPVMTERTKHALDGSVREVRCRSSGNLA
jgi:hypothetical protein